MSWPRLVAAEVMKSSSQLSKGLTILKMLSRGSLSGAQVARELDIDRSTALRLLRELESLGYVHRDAVTRHYEIVGEKIYQLLPREPSGRNASDEIREILLQIRDESKEAAMFAVPAEDSMVYMEFLPALFPVSVREDRGSVRPMSTSAVGRAYLAALEVASFEEVLTRLGRRGERSLSAAKLEDLRREVALTRERGYAVDNNETIPGVACVAVPLFARGLLIGAVGITAPRDRLPADLIDRWGRRLQEIPREKSWAYATRAAAYGAAAVADEPRPQSLQR